MQETKTIRVKKCPYCFRNISNEDAGFLLRTDGVRFQSPALNEDRYGVFVFLERYGNPGRTNRCKENYYR